MTAVDEGKTVAPLNPREQIRAMLPDHTHVQHAGSAVLWNWTTPGGRWAVTLDTPLWPFARPGRITFGGISASAELPADEAGLRALRVLLVALGAIEGG